MLVAEALVFGDNDGFGRGKIQWSWWLLWPAEVVMVMLAVSMAVLDLVSMEALRLVEVAMNLAITTINLHEGRKL